MQSNLQHLSCGLDKKNYYDTWVMLTAINLMDMLASVNIIMTA
jgi:hypothetical protein